MGQEGIREGRLLFYDVLFGSFGQKNHRRCGRNTNEEQSVLPLK